jgi:Holliday junction resolvase RusA-like endonuclease
VTIRITLDGPPTAKGRPRFTSVGGFGRAFTPAKTRTYEARLADAGRAVMDGAEPLQGPLSIVMHVRLPIPQSWSKARKQSARTGCTRPTGKPDCDNFLKVVDALNGIVWGDDGQIVQATCMKYYADEPCLSVDVVAI